MPSAHSRARAHALTLTDNAYVYMDGWMDGCVHTLSYTLAGVDGLLEFVIFISLYVCVVAISIRLIWLLLGLYKCVRKP